MSGLTRAKVYFAGICSIIVTAGVARFSYSSLLPIMQSETGLSDVMGGWLATSNYLGYLSGVVLAASLSNLDHKFLLYRLYLVLAVVTTAAMALTSDLVLWSILRYLAGICATAGFILSSGLILKWLVAHGHRGELGIHFTGVGVSIVSVALLVEAMTWLPATWQEQWLTLAIMAFVFSIPAWIWMPSPEQSSNGPQQSLQSDNPPSRNFVLVMLAAYFCAGYGFVVSATFIVDLVEGLPNMAGRGQWVFVLLGLAATPAVLIWDLVARKVGYLRALLLAYLLKIVGIMLPVFSQDFYLVSLSAVLFGATFIACVSLVLTMAGHLFPSNPSKLMGKMTIAYSVAQILAPVLTGFIVGAVGNYNASLYISGAFMLVGTALIIVLIAMETQGQARLEVA